MFIRSYGAYSQRPYSDTEAVLDCWLLKTPPAALIYPTEHSLHMLQRHFAKQPHKFGVRPSPIQRLSGWGKTILMVIRTGLVCSLFLEEVETFQEKQ